MDLSRKERANKRFKQVVQKEGLLILTKALTDYNNSLFITNQGVLVYPKGMDTW